MYVYFSRLSHLEYNILTSKIIALFPNENPLTYYVAAIKKADSRTKKHIAAKGKLVDKIKNLLFIGKETTLSTPPNEEQDNSVCADGK